MVVVVVVVVVVTITGPTGVPAEVRPINFNFQISVCFFECYFLFNHESINVVFENNVSKLNILFQE